MKAARRAARAVAPSSAQASLGSAGIAKQILHQFKKLGFIGYEGEHPLKINSSLLNVVLHN